MVGMNFWKSQNWTLFLIFKKKIYFISLLKLSMPNEHVFKISSWAFHLYELYEFSFGHF